MTEQTSHVVLGFLPHLDYSVPFPTSQLTGPESAKDIEALLSGPVPEFRAVAWLLEGDRQPIAALAVPGAAELARQMRLWSNNKVADWFGVELGDDGTGFWITLHPNGNQSLERYKMRLEASGIEVPVGGTIKVLSASLGFAAPLSDNYRKLRPLAVAAGRIGLMLFEPVDPMPQHLPEGVEDMGYLPLVASPED